VYFAFTAEQEELRRTVRRFLDEKSPESEVRRLMETDTGYDEAVWAQLSDQLGLQGLAVPEEYGGAGCSAVEVMIVLEEMGRSLYCGPYFSTVAMALPLLEASGDTAAQARYLPRIAQERCIATVALVEASARWDEEGVQMTAQHDGTQWRLSGEKLFVIDGQVADLILVAARTTSGVSVFAVEGDAAALTRSPLSTMDQTRKQSRLRFDGSPAALIGEEGAGWPALSRMLDRAVIALAAEQVGGAERVLEMAVDYAKTRIQFGKPIGSFQAIKHKCADVLLKVESAKSAARYAAWAAAEDSAEVPEVASLAKAYCSESYLHAAAENIQVHGGIGFTWEHPAHLYFKRAKTSELLFGDPVYHRELLATRLAI
jgi:alkylation response protein AidB-like acyl-CoA dehydrogenase